jgi:murein DD-endopeptidase MepM/ murein hydrolase activator NlpD
LSVHPNPLLGRIAPSLTPIRTGGETGLVGSFGPTRRNSDGSVKQHKGLDLLCHVGWFVFACHDGTVSVAGWENDNDMNQGYGRRVKIESGGGKLRTVYAHLSEIVVKVGRRVTAGDVIGKAGRTGNVGDRLAIPTHLHFETHIGNGNDEWTPVDPAAWIMGT